MFGIHNPYSAVVSALEAAHDSCSRATDEAAELRAARGGNDIANLVHTARNNLYEALHTAKQWQQSFEYHVSGGHGHRTEF